MTASEMMVTAADGGRFMAYVARPAGAVRGGMVLLQEIFGVNATMRGLADGLAAEGWLTLVPDLFWRQEPGLQLSDGAGADMSRPFALFGGFDLDLGMADIRATLAAARALLELAGHKVGTQGYCLGGRLAFLSALRTDADASISYYGVHLGPYVAEIGAGMRPLCMHMAGKDEYLPEEQQQAVIAALAEAEAGGAVAEVHRYPDCGHAFARPGGPHWDAEAAATADARSRAFRDRMLAAAG